MAVLSWTYQVALIMDSVSVFIVPSLLIYVVKFVVSCYFLIDLPPLTLSMKQSPSGVYASLPLVQTEPEQSSKESCQPQDHIGQINPNCALHTLGIRVLISILFCQTSTNVYLAKDAEYGNPKHTTERFG